MSVFCTERRYTLNGDTVRVIVADDVVSIPGFAGSPGWSMGGFGGSISVEWLLFEGGLPGSKQKKTALARMIVDALDQHSAALLKERSGAALVDAMVGPRERPPVRPGSSVPSLFGPLIETPATPFPGDDMTANQTARLHHDLMTIEADRARRRVNR